MKHHLLIVAPALILASCTTTSVSDGKTTTKVSRFDPDATAAILKAADESVALGLKLKAVLGNSSDGKTVR